MQATTGEAWEKRYSPNFRDTNGSSDSLRRQSSTKRKRDEVLRLVSRLLNVNLNLERKYVKIDDDIGFA